jgi:hypothetical protein
MNTVLKVTAIVALIAGAILCAQLAVVGLIVGGMASDTGVQWWSFPLVILMGGVPACLAFVLLRLSLQLGRTLLRKNGSAEERAKELRRRPISGQELLTAALVVGVLVALFFLAGGHR